jgi:CubicO group peptidase (beta-lactamase class C family)
VVRVGAMKRRVALLSSAMLTSCAGTGPPSSVASQPTTPTVEVAPAVPPMPVTPRADLDAIGPFVEDMLATFRVPGLAMAVVQDGKVVYMKGFGLRDSVKNLPVTTKTLFGIGSITKSMTGAALGTLVDEGKLDWDTPVVRYLPEFKLYDEYATEHASPRDLLSHRTGVPDHWFLWWENDAHLTRAQLLSRLRFLEPNHELRTTFEYNSLMYVVLGELGARIAGEKSAEDFIAHRLWQPLGMTQSNFSVYATQKAQDHATGVHRVGDVIEATKFHDQDVVGPAGSVNSNVEDMARFVAFYANGGTFGGKAIVSTATMRAMQMSQMPPTSMGTIHPELSPVTVALGLDVRSYRGHRLIMHGGGADGFTAQFAALPDDHLGVIVLTNGSSIQLPIGVANFVFDRLLGLAPIDWKKLELDHAQAEWKNDDEAAAKPLQHHERTHPSHPLEEYAGDYTNPAYGDARVEQNGASLRLVFHGPHPLEHVHFDVFGVAHDRRDDFDRMRLVFATDESGDVVSFSMPLEPATKPMVFTRGVSKALRDPAYLARFVGVYVMGPQKWTIEVALRGASLVAIAPSGPPLTLVPRRRSAFTVEDRPGDSVEFGDDGAVTIHTADGASATGKKK